MSEELRLYVEYNGKNLVADVKEDKDVGTDGIHIENLKDEATGKVVEATSAITEAFRQQFITEVTSLELGFR